MGSRYIKDNLRPPSCRHKNRWADEHYAERARRKLQQKYGWLFKVYLCGHCGDFHVSRVRVDGRPVPIVGVIQTEVPEHE